MRRNWDVHFLTLAAENAKMGTCIRRKVGCVITDEANRVLSMGFNGVPPGMEHCDANHRCPGAMAKSGSALDECEATHAEANALLQCPDISRAYAAYVTCSPCVGCVKLLLATNIQRVVFTEEYPHPTAKERWLRQSLRIRSRTGDIWLPRTWEHVMLPEEYTEISKSS